MRRPSTRASSAARSRNIRSNARSGARRFARHWQVVAAVVPRARPAWQQRHLRRRPPERAGRARLPRTTREDRATCVSTRPRSRSTISTRSARRSATGRSTCMARRMARVRRAGLHATPPVEPARRVDEGHRAAVDGGAGIACAGRRCAPGDRLVDRCRKDAACSEAYPLVEVEFRELLKRLEKNPVMTLPASEQRPAHEDHRVARTVRRSVSQRPLHARRIGSGAQAGSSTRQRRRSRTYGNRAGGPHNPRRRTPRGRFLSLGHVH